MSLIQEYPETDEIIWDRKGSNNSVRIAVNIGDVVSLSNIYDRCRSFTTKDKDEKNLSDEAILQKKKALLDGHDRHTELDARAIGAGMVKACGDGPAGNSFSSGAFEVDVDLLKPDTEMEEQEDEATGAGAESGNGNPGASEGDPKKKENATADPEETARGGKKKGGYWDRDTAIAAKMRQEATALVNLTMQVQNKLEEGREQLKEVSKRSGADKEVVIEKETLQRRLEFLEGVLSQDSAVLKNLQGSVSTASQEADSSPVQQNASGTVTSWSNQISKAPPCDLDQLEFRTC